MPTRKRISSMSGVKRDRSRRPRRAGRHRRGNGRTGSIATLIVGVPTLVVLVLMGLVLGFTGLLPACIALLMGMLAVLMGLLPAAIALLMALPFLVVGFMLVVVDLLAGDPCPAATKSRRSANNNLVRRK